MKQFDEMFPSHIEIHTVGKVTPINVKQNKYDPYTDLRLYPRQCGVVLCVSVSNNGQEQSSESYLGNVNPIHTLIFNGKSQAATLPGLPAGRWTQCTQLHPDLPRYARFSCCYIILYHRVLLVWKMQIGDLSPKV